MIPILPEQKPNRKSIGTARSMKKLCGIDKADKTCDKINLRPGYCKLNGAWAEPWMILEVDCRRDKETTFEKRKNAWITDGGKIIH